MKILCLGNEFIKQDSLAKKVGNKLKQSFNIVEIADSFQLIDVLKQGEERDEKFVILDVVSGLNIVRILDLDELEENKILTAHDFDAGVVLKLLKPRARIVGIPMQGDVEYIENQVRILVSSF